MCSFPFSIWSLQYSIFFCSLSFCALNILWSSLPFSSASCVLLRWAFRSAIVWVLSSSSLCKPYCFNEYSVIDFSWENFVESRPLLACRNSWISFLIRSISCYCWAILFSLSFTSVSKSRRSSFSLLVSSRISVFSAVIWSVWLKIFSYISLLLWSALILLPFSSASFRAYISDCSTNIFSLTSLTFFYSSIFIWSTTLRFSSLSYEMSCISCSLVS